MPVPVSHDVISIINKHPIHQDDTREAVAWYAIVTKLTR